MTKLHKVTGKNRYCGPSAISTITGYTTDEGAALIRKASGRRSVKGTSTREMIDSLGYCGFGLQRVQGLPRMTLNKFYSEYQESETLYLIEVTGHWVVIKGNQFCDSMNKTPISTSKAPGKKRQVRKVWRVQGEFNPKRSDEIIEHWRNVVKVRNAENLQKRLLIKWAKDIGVSVEDESIDKDDFMYYVSLDRLADENDPFYDDHYAHTIREMVERISTYADWMNLETPKRFANL